MTMISERIIALKNQTHIISVKLNSEFNTYLPLHLCENPPCPKTALLGIQLNHIWVPYYPSSNAL